MYFSAKFGNKTILQEPLSSLMEQMKKLEWTDNKIYKLANSISIKPTFIKGNDEIDSVKITLDKINRDKEILNRFKDYLNPEEDFKERIVNLRDQLAEENNKDRRWTSKRNYENMIYSFINMNLDFNDLQSLKSIPEEEFSNLKNSKFLEFFKKYKYKILQLPEYFSLTINEKNELNNFLEKQIKNEKNIDDINSFHELIYDSNIEEISNFSLLGDYEKESKKNISDDKQFGELMIIEEFKKITNCSELTNEQILTYINVTSDFSEAAKLYYGDIYNKMDITLIYVFPNGERKKFDFNLLDDPNKLILEIYNLYPNSNNPRLFTFNRQEIIIPDAIKYIGGMKLSNNLEIYVQLN